MSGSAGLLAGLQQMPQPLDCSLSQATCRHQPHPTSAWSDEPHNDWTLMGQTAHVNVGLSKYMHQSLRGALKKHRGQQETSLHLSRGGCGREL